MKKATKVKDQSEFNNLMSLETKVFENLDGKVVQCTRLLALLNCYAPASYLQTYLGCTIEELKLSFMRLFSPIHMSECWEAAMNNNSDALKSHPYLVEKIKANELSCAEMEKYFLEVEQAKSFIMEFRCFSLTPKRMKEILDKHNPALLRMTCHEFDKIMDFNLPKDGLQPPFKLQHCLESILKFGNKKVVTLSQLERYLGCEPSYLDHQFSKLFEFLENDARVRIYKNLIYDYRRARFLENTVSLKETNFKKESEHEQ